MGFDRLEKPTMHTPVSHYGKVAPGLFETIVAKFGGMAGDKPMSKPVPLAAPKTGASAKPDKSPDPDKTQATKTTQPQTQEVS
jgi:hypothetical protein